MERHHAGEKKIEKVGVFWGEKTREANRVDSNKGKGWKG